MCHASHNLLLSQVLNLIVHRNDNAAIIPGRELRKLVYGRDSVFARSPSAAQIAAVTAEDVADFLHAWERPDGAVFGMAGVQLLSHLRHQSPVSVLDILCSSKLH